MIKKLMDIFQCILVTNKKNYGWFSAIGTNVEPSEIPIPTSNLEYNSLMDCKMDCIKTYPSCMSLTVEVTTDMTYKCILYDVIQLKNLLPATGKTYYRLLDY